MEFSKRLKTARKNKNLTQEQLASLIHVSRSLIARWEYGDVYPNINYLEMLAKVLDVSIDDLIDNEEKINVIKKQDDLLSKVTKNIKIAIYSVITVFTFSITILYFSDIYWYIGKDYSTGVEIEKVFYYCPLEGIANNLIWISLISITVNISLFIILNIYTFRKKELNSKSIKVLLIIFIVCILLAGLTFILGTMNPPRLK